MSGRFPHAICAAVVVVAAALWLPTVSQADYEQVGNFAQSGQGEQLSATDIGAAVNVSGAGGVEPGSLYVAAEQRVLRYGSKGDFKEAWGWNTIAAGPDLPNQVSKLTVSATSGSYRLDVRTAQGLAKFTEGSKVLTKVKTHGGGFHVGDIVSGGYTQSGSTITAVGPETLELSLASTVGAIPQTTPFQTHQTTAPIAYNATAVEVKAALVALPAFEAADVSVTGGPGDASGTTPYEISFEGAYTGTTVGLAATESSLAGGVPSSSATIATLVDPQGTPHYERCRVEAGDVCTLQQQGGYEEEAVGRFSGLQGIAVDQSTGYVYVLNEPVKTEHYREHNLIEVFSADGSQSIARFGDASNTTSSPRESIEEGPEKLHRVSPWAAMAVDDAGNLYVSDTDWEGIATEKQSRVMCFRPQSAGDYEHYVYCGRSQDIKLGSSENRFEFLALDDAGHLYGARTSKIAELSSAEPTAQTLCTLSPSPVQSMTVNPVTGEVFYFLDSSDNSVHRLRSCDPEKGNFKEAQSPVKASPETKTIKALAFNPSFHWGAERPAGVLYGANPGSYKVEGIEYFNGNGYIFAPAEVHPPSVQSESAFATRTTSTILRAQIDPHGYGTHYSFQYLTETEYEANEPSERFAGAMEAPAGGGEIGGGSVGQATASVTGLQPDTAYRFRVIATSECDEESGEPCVSEGEAAAFATYPLYPPGLPDHRAYELVSPSQKHGGEVIPAEPNVGSCGSNCKPTTSGAVFPRQTSPDGEAVAYEGQPFSPTEGAVNFSSYLSHRSAAGWQTTTLSPALLTYPGGAGHLAFDSSLEHGLLFQGLPQFGLESSPTLSPEAPAKFPNLYAQDTAAPGTFTPLVTEVPPNRIPGTFKISYAGSSADLSRLFFSANAALTQATTFAPEAPDPGLTKNDLYEWHEGRLTLVNVAPGNVLAVAGAKFALTSPDTHAVSEDGSRAYFEDEAGQLYAREGGEGTIEVPDPGHFLTASPDGSEVLLSNGHLYDLETAEVTDLSEGMGGFQGIAGQSKDLSHIYFVDTAALTGSEENEAGETAEAGKSNLYSRKEGETAFVARLATSGEFVDGSDWAADPSARTAEASPQGRYFAFTSYAPLTGYDNVGPCDKHIFEKVLDGPCREAFLYDSQTGKLLCASCSPTGEAPLGGATLRRIQDPSPAEALPQPRYLTDEGRLYFDSADSLSSRDTNEGVEDVYEFEPPGAGTQGTCQRQAGCVFLISAGSEPVDSNLIAVDETGKNVFFDTRDELTLKDKDELLDVYDAREGGGIASESEVARAECQGEACQTPASAPNDPTPGSSSFDGPGNVKEPPAAKKHAKKKHKNHAKKHKKKRHAKKHKRAAKRNRGGAK